LDMKELFNLAGSIGSHCHALTLGVSLEGVTLKPAFALGGWVGFEAMGSEAMMMGDLVLLEDEINPVMNVL
jgi:Domain of Unknown Function (DUF1259)